jgi:serine/threonine protein kinase/Tfp pilus assembly protein PilF
MVEPTLPEESIFTQALEIASAAERAAFLDKACGDNAALRADIEALLRASQKSGDLLDLPEDDTNGRASSEGPGTVIGPYKLLELIGEGGMGAVWMAEQIEPIQRRVALKVIKEGMDSKQVLARFEAERQALALMDHPNIARVLDAGKAPSGRPYFVMELVKGKPITAYCDDQCLAVPDRLELFGDVCRAVQHAHQKGIIHRDLKPSNVLIAPFDGKPVVKVIDFGVAKAIGHRLTDKTLFTGFGAVVGTPEYMSPEQAELNNQDIDTRSDIYALGVVLYELLTGSTPLTHKRIQEEALLDVLRVIREEEPPKPSTRLSETKETLPLISAQRQTEPRKLTKLLRGELDWIVMKALDKDRNRRYETANSFAMDVQRYLADEPVQACPPSARYRFQKFARRNKAALITVAMFTLALLIAVAALSIGTVLTTRAWSAEKRAHGRAEANFQRTRAAVHDFFTTVSQSKLLDVPGVQPVRRELLESAVRYYQDLARERDDDPTIRADLALAHLRLAEAYYELGENTKAVASMGAGLDLAEMLIENHPDDRDLLRRLAGFWRGTRRTREAHPGVKDFDAAERTLNRFIRVWQTLSAKDPSERAFRSDLAIVYHRLGQLLDLINRHPEAMTAAEKGAALWEALIRDFPDEPEYLAAQIDAYDLLWWLARVSRLRQQEFEFARKSSEVADKLAASNPTAPPYRDQIAKSFLNHAGALRDQNKPAEAEKQFRRALAIWEKLGDEYPRIIRYRAQVLAVCASLAPLLKSMGQPDEAERFRLRFAEVLDRTRIDLPGAEPEEVSQLADVIRIWGLSMEDAKGRETLFQQARGMYQSLIDRDPDNPDHKRRLAWLHAVYSGLLRREPERRREAEKYLRDAAAILEKLASDAPANALNRTTLARTHRELIDLLRSTGQQNEVAKVYQWDAGFYEKLTAQFPENREYAWLANQFRGQSHNALGEWDQALVDFSKAIDVDPKRWESWSERGFAQLGLRQWDKSIRDYTEAIKLAPDAQTNWHHRRLAYAELGQWDNVITDCSELLKRYPNDSAAYHFRAVAHVKLNQPEKAVSDLRQAFARGYTDLEGVKNDDRFARLRTREDYKQLVAETEAKKKK